jgi:trk system potassium uptake protein TrkA
MKIVIMGCGRVGAQLANSLDAEGHDVTILDIDAYSFDRFLSSEFRGIALLGSGMDEESLRKAEIEKADAFIAVAHGDNRNVMACQMAKHIFHVPKVICRIYDPQRRDMYIPLGIDAVSPTTLVAQMLREKLGA